MGTSPRIPGGGGKFKKAFEDLASAEKILLWTNPNPTSQWNPPGTITLSGQRYAAYSIFYKLYATAGNTQGASCIAVRSANCYASANGYTRVVTVKDDSIVIGTPLNNGGWENCLPYQVFGIKGTEM